MPRVDRDGVRVYEQPGGRNRVRVLLVALAIAVVAVVGVTAVTVWVLHRESAAPAVTRVAPAPAGERRAVAEPAAPTAPRVVGEFHAVRIAPTPGTAVPAPVARGRRPEAVAGAGSAEPAREPAETESAAREREQHRRLEQLARDVVEGMRAAGKTEGLAAFPPPGTNPVRTGLVVPEDFELPEGYVRYYQVTDEGKRLEAILMFSPDYQFVDGGGQPIPLPEDGIVPPEMAPAGLPLRTLELPESARAPARGAVGR